MQTVYGNSYKWQVASGKWFAESCLVVGMSQLINMEHTFGGGGETKLCTVHAQILLFSSGNDISKITQ